MFAKFCTLLVGMIRVWSRVLGNELAVIISPHKIELEMIDPDDSPRFWDESMFSYGNLYFRDYANPIKPKYPETEEQAEEQMGLQLIASDRYKEFMEESLIADIINEGKEDQFPTLMHILLLSGFMHLVTISILLYITMG